MDVDLCHIGNCVARELSYQLVFGSDESRRQLEKTVAVSLLKRDRDRQSGHAKLIFNAIFTPHKPIQLVGYNCCFR